jgi:hypothetical protein
VSNANIPKPTSYLDCALTDHSVGLKHHDRREYVLSFIRVARARCQVTISDLDSIGLALRYDLISAAQAVAMMRELGAYELALAIPPDIKLGAAA